MKCEIIAKKESKEHPFCFVEWSKEKGLHDCGKDGAAFISGKALCLEHVADGLMRCGAGAYMGVKVGKSYPVSYSFKEDFLIACKKEHEKVSTDESIQD